MIALLAMAGGVELPWPIAIIATLAAILTALGSGLTLLRSASVKANLELLRGERDDYKNAYEHADEEREKCQILLDQKVHEYEAEVHELRGKVETLSSVVSGAAAVRELGDLLLTVEGQHHSELLGALRATMSEVKTVMGAILALLGQGGKLGGKRRSDPQPGD